MRTDTHRDAVIERCKAHVDRTRIRENLKLTPEQRILKLIELQEFDRDPADSIPVSVFGCKAKCLGLEPHTAQIDPMVALEKQAILDCVHDTSRPALIHRTPTQKDVAMPRMAVPGTCGRSGPLNRPSGTSGARRPAARR